MPHPRILCNLIHAAMTKAAYTYAESTCSQRTSTSAQPHETRQGRHRGSARRAPPASSAQPQIFWMHWRAGKVGQTQDSLRTFTRAENTSQRAWSAEGKQYSVNMDRQSSPRDADKRKKAQCNDTGARVDATHRASSVQSSISPACPVVPVATTLMSVLELPLYPNATQSYSLPSSYAWQERWREARGGSSE